MATLLVKDLDDQVVHDYEIASVEEKLQVNKVIEDILSLWSRRHTEISSENGLWQEMADFLENHQTFALDWEHNKLSQEEMNERELSRCHLLH